MSYVLIVLVPTLILMLICSAFFSVAETGLTSASRAKMHTLEKEGNHKAKLVNIMRSKSTLLLGTILLWGNLLNAAISSVITSVFTPIFGDVGIIYATTLATILILIFCEVVPKSFAINEPDKVSIGISPIVYWMTVVSKPLLVGVEWISDKILYAFGVKHHGNIAQAMSDEELRGAIELHHEPEDLTIGATGKKAMLRSIMDLKDVPIENIMIHRTNVFMLDINQPQDVIVEAILDCPYTRVLLFQHNQDNIVGVIHAKKILRMLRSKTGETILIKDLMQAPWYVPEKTSLLEQLEAFRERHEHFAIVVDEYGTFNGIVTLEDILEEIVGDITDEYDTAEISFRQEDDGSYLIPGSATIRDLNREFDWELPDEDAATLAGLLMRESREIPDVGQVLNYFGFRFEIIRRDRNVVAEVKVLKIEPEEG